jgi:hypothetical protein
MAKAKAKVKLPSAMTGPLGSDIDKTSLGLLGSAVPTADKFKPSAMGPGSMKYQPSSLISAKMPQDFDSVAHKIEEMEMQAEAMPEKVAQIKAPKKATVKKKSASKKKSVRVKSSSKKRDIQQMSDEVDAGRGAQYVKGY